MTVCWHASICICGCSFLFTLFHLKRGSVCWALLRSIEKVNGGRSGLCLWFSGLLQKNGEWLEGFGKEVGTSATSGKMFGFWWEEKGLQFKVQKHLSSGRWEGHGDKMEPQKVSDKVEVLVCGTTKRSPLNAWVLFSHSRVTEHGLLLFFLSTWCHQEEFLSVVVSQRLKGLCFCKTTVGANLCYALSLPLQAYK